MHLYFLRNSSISLREQRVDEFKCISPSLLCEDWLYVTVVMQRAVKSSRMPWSRVQAAIRSDRAYRFISRFFIAPVTPLTRLIYADVAATDKVFLYHRQLARKICREILYHYRR